MNTMTCKRLQPGNDENTSNKRVNQFTSLWVPESSQAKDKKHDEKIHTIKPINETQGKQISA